MHSAEHRGPLVNLSQEGIAEIRRHLGHRRVGAIQGHVGHHAEETGFLTVDDHVATDGERFQGDMPVQLDV